MTARTMDTLPRTAHPPAAPRRRSKPSSRRVVGIRETKTFRGPNVWCRDPAICLILRIDALDHEQLAGLPELADRLTQTMTAFANQQELPPVDPYGSVAAASDIAASLARLSLDLQRLAGIDLEFGYSRPTSDPSMYEVVYQFRSEKSGLTAGRLAVGLLNSLLAGEEDAPDRANRWLQRTSRVQKQIQSVPLHSAMAAAIRRGIPARRGSPGPVILEYGEGRYRHLLRSRIPSTLPFLGRSIARDKYLTTHLLREAGIPTPANAVVYSVEEALAAVDRLGIPVVLKPIASSLGRGVFVNVASEEKIRAFFPLSASYSRSGRVVVEQFIRGQDHRIVVINDKVVAVGQKVPAHVIGDGTHDIRTLIDQTNAQRRAGSDPRRLRKTISVDNHTLDTLESQGLTLDDIPKHDEIVWLKQVGNRSAGGWSVDRTEDIHPDNVKIARQAAKVVGLNVTGLDIVMPDISQSMWTTGGAVIEVNGSPQYRSIIQPAEGKSRDVGGAIIDMLYPPGQPFRVPIILTSRSPGSAETCRWITHILTIAGHSVGLATRDGLVIDGMHFRGAESRGDAGITTLRNNPVVEIAVVEADTDEIIKDGLPFDSCDVGLITSLSRQSTPFSRPVESVLTGAVDTGGVIVLNADSPGTSALGRDASQEVILFSMVEDDPVVRQHFQNGSRTVVLRQSGEEHLVTVVSPGGEIQVLPVAHISGHSAGHTIESLSSVLAAVAVAVARDVPVDTIREALRA